MRLFEVVLEVLTSAGEQQEKAIEEAYEKLKVIEKGMKEFLPNGGPTIDGQKLGLLDIMVSVVLATHKANEEVFGVKILDPDLMYSWVQQLNELPAVEEVVPPHEKVVTLHFVKENGLKPSS